ncbi:ATP-dependent Clp protease proteolytic subunit [Desulfosporosinus sp. FKA]|uniref:SDH family Clp fold serine proteinase n=1 Tax=Desulfosporosinus sp. FKA TaxID=1969834 RepID=UPI000B49D349|nr:ATP-dependent Clp protease proteolytic subunit [Desulfosporosinus sp. FKA]
MPNWNEVLEEIQSCKRIDALDFVRRKYLKELHAITGRNVIAYYSGWLQKSDINKVMINDDDKNGLMAVIHGLDKSKGLDLLLHTPGGDIAATESIVDYLRKIFGTDIRAIIPQLAMSAGTMIACSCKEIVMGKQSSLGPIDPQFNGISTYGVIEEFERALKEIKEYPERIPAWQVIISKYHPTFIGDCEKAIDWSTELVSSWLETGMFSGESDSLIKSERIAKDLRDHTKTKSHARHIPYEECERLGLKVCRLEDDHKFQDTVLTIHHAYMHTFSNSPAVKIIENHDEKAMIQMQQQMQQMFPIPQPPQGGPRVHMLQGFPIENPFIETQKNDKQVTPP